MKEKVYFENKNQYPDDIGNILSGETLPQGGCASLKSLKCPWILYFVLEFFGVLEKSLKFETSQI